MGQELRESLRGRRRGGREIPRLAADRPGEAGRVSATLAMLLIALALVILVLGKNCRSLRESPGLQSAPLTYRVFCRGGRVEVSTRTLEELRAWGAMSVCQYKGETDTLTSADATARLSGGVGAACKECDQGREKHVYCVEGKILVEERTLHDMGLMPGEINCELTPEQAPVNIDAPCVCPQLRLLEEP